ncbi:MAG: tyrosine-type recombinase/integrase [Christensenellaceae bacterium]|jgi:site-specific recombinase XerD|nr:tyrosine-type recombinase/integrase [Christensenellaceae bacterium]
MSDKYYDEFNKINIIKLQEFSSKLPDFCFDFFIGIEMRTTPLTRLGYADDILLFLNYIISSKGLDIDTKSLSLDDLKKVTSIEIEHYLSYLSCYSKNGKTQSNKAQSKSRKLSSIRAFFKYLYEKDLLPQNVASKVAVPKLHDKPIIRLESSEVVKLLNNAESDFKFKTKIQNSYNLNTKDRDIAILTLLLGTGIRVSELVGLDLLDIDLDCLSFVVTRKGGNKTILYFTKEIRDAIEIYLPTREYMLEKAGIQNEYALFLSLQNKRISVRAVQKIVKKHAETVTTLKKISPHKLRSTFGTSLYGETKDIYVVAEVLGHKDINTTKRHYAATSEAIKRAASKKIKLRPDNYDE